MCSENNRAERDFGNCYFCGVKLKEYYTEGATGVNSANPLPIPDENGVLYACCHNCDVKYVHRTRRALWCEEVSRKEYSELLPYVKVLPVRFLEEILDSPADTLNLFRAFKVRCEQRGIRLSPEPMEGLLTEEEYQEAYEKRFEVVGELRAVRAMLDENFDAFGPHIKPLNKLKLQVKDFIRNKK